LLVEVDRPVLIMNGELDRPNRKGEKDFASAAHDARVQVIPGAGHACNVEQPEIYTHYLREFAMSLDWIKSRDLVDIEGLNSKI
jgi:pimeloyl-ACP methyl ester carboxylesterase